MLVVLSIVLAMPSLLQIKCGDNTGGDDTDDNDEDDEDGDDTDDDEIRR